MAEKKYGGEVPVDLNPILTHVAAKILADKKALQDMLDDHDGARDFEEQNRLLAEFQAGIRTVDILDGRVDFTGQTNGQPKIVPAQNGQPPKAMTAAEIGKAAVLPGVKNQHGDVDDDVAAMAKKLAPKPAVEIDMDELEKKLAESLPGATG